MTPYIDPLALQRLLWPDVYFYSQQRDLIYSVEHNDETYCVAGNQLGKDYVTGFIVLCKFLRCIKTGRTCRIVTTSVAEHHLAVLWGEISRFITTSAHPLLDKDGGPLTVNHMEIRRASEKDAKNPLNYLVGRVSAKGEGLAGHHAEETLGVGDEASGIADETYKMFQGWTDGGYNHAIGKSFKGKLFIGNPNPCNQFFYKNVKAGDLLAPQVQELAA